MFGSGYTVAYKPVIHQEFYPVTLYIGKSRAAELELPFKVFPDNEHAIALFMSTQLDFDILDSICDILVENVRAWEPEVVVGIPTLGLPLAEKIARRLKHANYVPLTTSKKFWQKEELGIMVESITSLDPKCLYLDPDLVNRLIGKKSILIVDDVVCTGGNLAGAFLLLTGRLNELALKILGYPIIDPSKIYACVVLSETTQWQSVLSKAGFDWKNNFVTTGYIPLFKRNSSGLWIPDTT